MASLSNDPGGRKRITFVAPDGSRPSLRLGKVSRRDAEQIKRHVEALLVAKVCAQPLDRQTALWLEEIQEPLRRKLVAVGLVQPTEAEPALPPERRLLGPFLRHFILGREDVKPSTLEIWSQPCRNLIEFLGDDRTLSTVTPGDAEQFKQWLMTQGLALATVAKRLASARTFFHAAIKHKFVKENPFLVVKIPTADVSLRQRFVTRSVLEQLFSVASDDWRIILSLARLGGLRCPSEALSLEWGHIDWTRNRITVPSPKTERYAGKGCRVIPLFADLRPHLEAARENAQPEQIHVVPDHYLLKAQGPRGWRNCNLHTAFKRLVLKAGLTPWPRLFHNLRSSRETELLAEFPPHVVARWMGHDVQTSMKHYAQVTDDDFERASRPEAARQEAQREEATTGEGQQGREQADRREEEERARCVLLPLVAGSLSGGGGITEDQRFAAEITSGTGHGAPAGTQAVQDILALIDQLGAGDRALLLATLLDERAAA